MRQMENDTMTCTFSLSLSTSLTPFGVKSIFNDDDNYNYSGIENQLRSMGGDAYPTCGGWCYGKLSRRLKILNPHSIKCVK